VHVLQSAASVRDRQSHLFGQAKLRLVRFREGVVVTDMPVIPMPDGRPLYYGLDMQGEAYPWTGSLLGWAAHMDTLGVGRILAEHVGTDPAGRTWRVITAFLGMDDAAAVLRPAARPEVFGTILWLTGHEFFDATRAEALARHARVVAACQDGLPLSEEGDHE
jgi:hypothetical protein